jgi:hypothetical protein
MNNVSASALPTQRPESATLYFIIIIMLIISRNYLYFTNPRIWAEEGSVYIQSVLDKGWAGSFFLPHLGYYSIFSNYETSILIPLLGLKLAPYGIVILCTIYTAMILVFPAIFNSPYWSTPEKKTLVILSSIFISPGEIWLNTVNMQFYFCLFSCYLLLADFEDISGSKLNYCLFFLINSAFTGVTSIIIIPFYAYKYIKYNNSFSDRARKNAITFILILSAGLFVQIISLYYLSAISHEPERFSFDNYKHFVSGIFHTTLDMIPTIGTEYFPWAEKIYYIPKLAFVIIICAIFYYSYEERYIIVLSSYIVLVFVFLSLEMRGGMRYGYAPDIILMIAIINGLYNKNKSISVPAKYAFLFTLSLNIINYYNTEYFYNKHWLLYDNALQESESNGGIIKIFPQWEGTNWMIKIPKGL